MFAALKLTVQHAQMSQTSEESSNCRLSCCASQSQPLPVSHCQPILHHPAIQILRNRTIEATDSDRSLVLIPLPGLAGAQGHCREPSGDQLTGFVRTQERVQQALAPRGIAAHLSNVKCVAIYHSCWATQGLQGFLWGGCSWSSKGYAIMLGPQQKEGSGNRA
eukprot:18773-Pelagomonas_calceolata.AAC.3